MTKKVRMWTHLQAYCTSADATLSSVLTDAFARGRTRANPSMRRLLYL